MIFNVVLLNVNTCKLKVDIFCVNLESIHFENCMSFTETQHYSRCTDLNTLGPNHVFGLVQKLFNAKLS